MSDLDQIIRDEIAARGPMDFARYMELALYHPQHGYYSSGHHRTGWRGDFVTSSELDPAFGELWATAFEQIWDACGRPDSFDLVEVGPGEGSFAAAVLGAASGDFVRALRVQLVERVETVRRRQREVLAEFDNVSWAADINDVPTTGAACVFANEVVDNMPVALIEERGGRLVELCVDVVEAELALVERPAADEFVRFVAGRGGSLPEGHRAEIPVGALEFAATSAALVREGAVVIVDYGDRQDALFERPGGTLVCYSAAGVDDRLLERPGTKDITAHANWTALARAFRAGGARTAGPRPQRDVLRSLGIGALEHRLRSEAADALARGSGTGAVRAMSRRGALGALLDPGGLGGLGVLAALKDISEPGFIRVARPPTDLGQTDP